MDKEQAQGRRGLLSPERLRPVVEMLTELLGELDRILLGRSELHKMVIVGILSRGHILLEGLPGVGKTALVKALSEILNLDFKRLQFTPDLMPSDILGTYILQEVEEGKREFVFQKGPIFTNILLADEINRASPKTQSAMLEAMQERRVTLMGTTRSLPDPFFVLASQNPIELEGTYPLPEAQLDRFLFKLNVADVQVDTLESIILTRRHGQPPKPEKRFSLEDLERAFELLDEIFLPKPVAHYIARLVAATHPDNPEATEFVKEYVSFGASPRAAIALAEAARSHALIEGRPTVDFDDVIVVAPHILNHRLLLNYRSKLAKVTSFDVIEQLLHQLDELGLNLPQDIKVMVE